MNKAIKRISAVLAMEVDERELVAAIVAGDRDAFEELVRRYERLVARVVPRAIAGPRDREELCQDVFLRVYRGLRSFQHESRLSTWIARVAYRVSVDALRRRRLETSEAVEIAAGEASALDRVLEEERQEAVWRAVDRLPLAQLPLGFAAGVVRRIRPERVVDTVEWLVALALALSVIAVSSGPLGLIFEGLPPVSTSALAAFLTMLALDRLFAGMSVPKKRYPRSAR